MAIQLRRTSEVHEAGVKALVYGAAGAGKTTVAATMPDVVILSAESGLLSIAGADLPFIEVDSMATLEEAYRWLSESAEAREFQSVALDSISEIAEVVLSVEKAKAKDPRQAYGEMQDKMNGLIRAFRDLPGRHVLFTAKMERTNDETGRLLYAPSMPGQKLGQNLPYFFDLVLASRVETVEGQIVRRLQTQTDGIYTAKARGYALDFWEEPDFSSIVAKIRGGA